MILGYYEKEMVFLKRIFKQFRYRKMVLAAADAFIIAIAALMTNYFFSLFNDNKTLMIL